ncbi:baeRF3 domain-containing protein [Arundinibacter roseus]|uniref:Chemotaxis protein n=1 Tax=Arundinibacter roseus TaxID=2070510 RepID=A0A4V2X865_9BACT|nr:hypothetical protein [Arundinibacter roseus]TDB58675.1 hypothetical protein EZE20_22920 [Arundinibacter roseus]
MALKEQLQKLATEKNSPCVTISMNTHRTHPDNAQDEIVLKNLLKEAEERVIDEFGKRPVSQLLEKIELAAEEIDVNQNLDSLHIFLSNDTFEIVKSSWETSNNEVHISDSFAIRSLIKNYNRSENYLVMLFSQSGVQLFEAVNDDIVKELKNDDFPFSENRHYNTHSDKGSDPKHLDDLVREFSNKVDKALVNVYNETELKCVVIATEDNYSRLQQVADKPIAYLGFSPIDYNNTTPHHIATQSWELVKEQQKQRRTESISEMQEAVAHGRVLTDIQEIFQASIDGRADLLIVHQDFSQAVVMKDERTFDLVEDATQPNTIDDITSIVAWEVISKKGRVIFTSQEELSDLGNIVLKTRY